MRWQVDIDVDDILVKLRVYGVVNAGTAWLAYAPNETPVLCDTFDDAAAVVRERLAAANKRKKKATR